MHVKFIKIKLCHTVLKDNEMIKQLTLTRSHFSVRDNRANLDIKDYIFSNILTIAQYTINF